MVLALRAAFGVRVCNPANAVRSRSRLDRERNPEPSDFLKSKDAGFRIAAARRPE